MFRKKFNYLPELFLVALKGDYSYVSVIAALDKCNREILKRLHSNDDTNLKDYIFNGGKCDSITVKQEFYDFYDVYNEFAPLLKAGTANRYLILQNYVDTTIMRRALLYKDNHSEDDFIEDMQNIREEHPTLFYMVGIAQILLELNIISPKISTQIITGVSNHEREFQVILDCHKNPCK